MTRGTVVDERSANAPIAHLLLLPGKTDRVAETIVKTVGAVITVARSAPEQMVEGRRSLLGPTRTPKRKKNEANAAAICTSRITSRPASRPKPKSNTPASTSWGSTSSAYEKYVDGQFDYNKCRLVFKVDGAETAAK